MASSAAVTVEAYLDELPPDRRETVARVRDLVNAHLPAGYVESMRFGMIAWEIPLATYPTTYNRQPLQYAALASQKGNVALYLMTPYMLPAIDAQLKAAWTAAGRKLDMGKSCLRFRTWDDLVPDAVARCIAAMTPDEYIAHYEAARGTATPAATTKASTAKKTTSVARTKTPAAKKTTPAGTTEMPPDRGR